MKSDNQAEKCDAPDQMLDIDQIDYLNLGGVCVGAIIRRGRTDKAAQVVCSRMVTTIGNPATLAPCRRCDNVFAVSFDPFTSRDFKVSK